MKQRYLLQKVINFSCCLNILILFANCASIQPNPQYYTECDKYHIVKKGETLDSISKKYGISVEKLKLFNNLKDEEILVGQKIYLIPKRPKKRIYISKHAIPESGFHVISEGESIEMLAKMYDITLIDLIDYNNLGSLELKAGQKLWLRQPEGAEESMHTQKESEEQIESVFLPKPKIGEKSIKKKKKLSNLILPAVGTISSRFGIRNGRPHKGIDIAAAAGSPIYAVLDGEVAYVGRQKGYGNVIILKHAGKIMTVYAHNEANLVRENSKVKQGQAIARMGQSGRASGPHLHFEYRENGRAIDPEKILNF